jgi:hypothetical protein
VIRLNRPVESNGWKPYALESAPMDLVLAFPLLVDAATEGKKVITGMLIVGLIFISVIALGEFSRWARHRKH